MTFRLPYIDARMLFGALVMLAALPMSAALAQGVAPPPGPGMPSAPAANPVCQRLEAQLVSIDRANGEQGRAEQMRRYEEAAAKQQGELDRTTMSARRNGCEGGGFFSLFSGQSAQCGPINTQLQQMRGNLDQIMRQIEQLRAASGGSGQDAQRRSVLVALAQNNCGAQYAAAIRNAQPQQQSGGFLGALFGGNNPQQQQPMDPGAFPEYGAAGGTFRTMCVRTCDGFYFPVSFATSPARFADDERTCKAQCPASEAVLYTFRNPGEDMNQAVSASSGQPYTALPAAFRYRQEFNPSCSCKATGQTWADALKNIDDRAAASQQGDIIVTDERAKQMSAPPKGRPVNANPKGTPAPAPAVSSTPATAPADANRPIRSVGPTFIPQPKAN
jgi:hypothetical protein